MNTETTESTPVQGVRCYFSPKGGVSSRPSTCGTDAEGFVRVAKTGRLCPLCASCKKFFTEALESTRKKAGDAAAEAEYSDVPLEDGKAEYAAQPPRKP